MLPKQNRLPGSQTPFVLSSKTTLHNPFFSLKVSPSNHPQPRVGFIVSSKIAKKAVDRNKLKRLLRQLIYPHLKNLHSKTDLLFLAKHPLKIYLKPQPKASFNLQSVLLKLLKQAKLFNEKTSS